MSASKFIYFITNYFSNRGIDLFYLNTKKYIIIIHKQNERKVKGFKQLLSCAAREYFRCEWKGHFKEREVSQKLFFI